MTKLLDKLAQCVSRMSHCMKMFPRPDTLDPKAVAMCRPCKDDAHRMFVAYLNGMVTVDALLTGVIVSKGWMMSRASGMVELFARHMAGVDDDDLSRWWATNARGPELHRDRPSHKVFIEMVIRRYAELQHEPFRGTTEKLGAVVAIPSASGTSTPKPEGSQAPSEHGESNDQAAPDAPEEQAPPMEESSMGSKPAEPAKAPKRSRKADASGGSKERKPGSAVASLKPQGVDADLAALDEQVAADLKSTDAETEG